MAIDLSTVLESVKSHDDDGGLREDIYKALHSRTKPFRQTVRGLDYQADCVENLKFLFLVLKRSRIWLEKTTQQQNTLQNAEKTFIFVILVIKNIFMKK